MPLNRLLVFVILITLGISCSNPNPPFPERPSRGHEVLPEAVGFLNDFEGILEASEHRSLDSTLVAYERRTTNEIAIVTIKDIAPYDSIYDYSLDLSRYWGVGKKSLNNGILIALSKNLKCIQIQNGYGTEPLLTDEETQAILDSLMIPAFKQNNYYLGLKKGVEGIIRELKRSD